MDSHKRVYLCKGSSFLIISDSQRCSWIHYNSSKYQEESNLDWRAFYVFMGDRMCGVGPSIMDTDREVVPATLWVSNPAWLTIKGSYGFISSQISVRYRARNSEGYRREAKGSAWWNGFVCTLLMPDSGITTLLTEFEVPAAHRLCASSYSWIKHVKHFVLEEKH